MVRDGTTVMPEDVVETVKGEILYLSKRRRKLLLPGEDRMLWVNQSAGHKVLLEDIKIVVRTEMMLRQKWRSWAYVFVLKEMVNEGAEEMLWLMKNGMGTVHFARRRGLTLKKMMYG